MGVGAATWDGKRVECVGESGGKSGGKSGGESGGNDYLVIYNRCAMQKLIVADAAPIWPDDT
jgi:hypothetical protein